MLGFFSLFWAWWYVFDFFLGMAGLYVIYLLIEEKSFSIEKIKQREKSEDDYNIYSVYLQEYQISVILKYPEKEDEEEERLENDEGQENQTNYKNNLESILKQIKEKIENQRDYKGNLEEKLQEINNVKYIIPNIYKNKQNKKLYNYLEYLASESTNHHVNLQSKANVFYVDSSALPENVLGMYVPSTHTIYIANNLSKDAERFVYFHEEYHSIYGAGEGEADNYAFQRTGYNLRQAA